MLGKRTAVRGRICRVCVAAGSPPTRIRCFRLEAGRRVRRLEVRLERVQCPCNRPDASPQGRASQTQVIEVAVAAAFRPPSQLQTRKKAVGVEPTALM